MSEATRKSYTICSPHCGNNPCSFEVESSGETITSFRANPRMRIKQGFRAGRCEPLRARELG